jgi:hypothetical protein
MDARRRIVVRMFALSETGWDGVDHPRGLDGINHSFGIEALDPDASTPLIDQAFQQLKKTDPGHLLHGTTYQLSRGNTLDTGWLIQSPNVWGMPASAVAVEPLGCQGCDADLWGALVQLI